VEDAAPPPETQFNARFIEPDRAVLENSRAVNNENATKKKTLMIRVGKCT